MKRDKLFYEIVESQLRKVGYHATSTEDFAAASLHRKITILEVEIALSELLDNKFEFEQRERVVIVK